MRVWMVLAAIALAPQNEAIDDRVDVIEVNHLYDNQGDLVLRQLIFWEWRPHEASFRVVAWRMLNSATQRPQRDARRGGFVATWRERNLLRRVRAPSMRETWTQYDPEVYDRRFLPQHRRRGLTAQQAAQTGPNQHTHRLP